MFTNERIKEMLALDGTPESALIDVLMRNCGSDLRREALDRDLPGVRELIEQDRTLVLDHASGLSADHRRSLVKVIGALEQQDRYVDLLLPMAFRDTYEESEHQAAQTELRRLPPDRIHGLVLDILNDGTVTERARAATFSAAAFGETSRGDLEARAAKEKSKPVLKAIDAALRGLDIAATSPVAASGREDGKDGYVALDGSFVEIPPRREDRILNAIRRQLIDGADARWIDGSRRAAASGELMRDFLRAEWSAEDLIDDVWPFFAEQLDILDEALDLRPWLTGAPAWPSAALTILEALPKVPNRYLQALMDFATGGDRRLRDTARRLLTGAPQFDTAIASLLTDSKQDIRASAADWLADRESESQVPALREALKKEKSELARTAILTALDRLGDDISDQFSEDKMLAEAQKGLSKTNAKLLDWFPFEALSVLRWRTGTPVNSDIVTWWVVLANKLRQPGGNALLELYLDRLEPEDAHRLGTLILRSWIEQDTLRPSDDEANAYAKMMADQTHNRLRTTPWQELFASFRREKLSEYLSSAAINKGILALTVRADGATAAQLGSQYLRDHNRRVSQCKALIEALAANPSPAAIQIVLATANRFKAKTVQTLAKAKVEEIADRRGWTTDELADRTIPTGDLDETGILELDCGDDRTYAGSIDPDGKLIVQNPTGKEVKSLPSARTEDEAALIKAAKKDLSSARKEIKQVNAMQSLRLQEAMCLERQWPAADWRKYLQGHPIVTRMVQRLVWIGLDKTGAPTVNFRPLDDGSLSDAGDQPVDPSAFDAVKLAHRSIVEPEIAEAWPKHFADYEIEPLFAQFSNPLLEPDGDEAKGSDIMDREGYMIDAFTLRGAATKLGYERGEVLDAGGFCEYVKRYSGAGYAAAVEFTGSGVPEENIHCALKAMRFHKLRADGKTMGQKVALETVPPVLLSECWNDLHRIAEAGSGYDADWQDKAYL